MGKKIFCQNKIKGKQQAGNIFTGNTIKDDEIFNTENTCNLASKTYMITDMKSDKYQVKQFSCYCELSQKQIIFS